MCNLGYNYVFKLLFNTIVGLFRKHTVFIDYFWLLCDGLTNLPLPDNVDICLDYSFSNILNNINLVCLFIYTKIMKSVYTCGIQCWNVLWLYYTVTTCVRIFFFFGDKADVNVHVLNVFCTKIIFVIFVCISSMSVFEHAQ